MASIKIADREWDLVGPSVDDDVRRLLSRYGEDELKEAIMRQTKKASGRKPDNDKLALQTVIDDEATCWLAGEDPFKGRSNYEIAKDYSIKIKGNSPESTYRRLLRKLKKNRCTWMLERAFSLSREGYPHQLHISALEELSELSANPIWGVFLLHAKTSVADYEAKIRHAPPADMDMCELEAVLMTPIRGIGLL